MAMTRLQPDTGTTLKPGPMSVVHPDRLMTDDRLDQVAAGTGLNGPFLADLLASCATHENMGVNLFRSLGAITANPMFQTTYARFGQDALANVEAYEGLITRLGGQLGYISPAGRMTEAIDAKLLEAFQGAGSADPATIDLKGVEAVLLASTMCVANIGVLRRIGDGLDDGDAKSAIGEAVATIEPPSIAHLEWAARSQQALILAQANSKLAQQANQAMETVFGKIKDLLR